MRILIALFLAMGISSAAAAEPVYVLTGSPPGGTYEAVSRSTADAFEASGREAEVMFFDNCVQMNNWVQNNPDKQSVATYTHAWHYVSDRNCKVDLTEQNFAGWLVESHDNVCWMKDTGRSVETFLTEPGTVGIYGDPFVVGLFKKQLELFEVDHKVLPYASFREYLADLKAGQIDYMVANSYAAVEKIGGECDFTTGPRPGPVKFSTLIDDPLFNQTSFRIGLTASGISPEEVRDVVSANPGAFDRVLQRGWTFRGPFTDTPISEDIQEINQQVQAIQ